MQNVAILTAGGLAPCLSSAIASLIQSYNALAPQVNILCYRHGYLGLLKGDKFWLNHEARAQYALLHEFGGSPLGNSRVKLTNIKDCLKRGLIQEGQDPRQVAAERLLADKIDVLHTIGGDDTNTEAAKLAEYLAQQGYKLTVLGLPKTVDNDVVPIVQTLGASTAAEQGARFFANVVAEHSANPRMLIVHEVMGRNCGWLTAATAKAYLEYLHSQHFLGDLGLDKQANSLHAVYLPEMTLDLEKEAKRLKHIMDTVGCVNMFVSEGAGVESIIKALEAEGRSVERDAFGHVKLDTINPGVWFSKQFAAQIGAEKTLVQKSGYFARSAKANDEDRKLIAASAQKAVECALRGESGVIGLDSEREGILRAIEFERIRGGKAFSLTTSWFVELLAEIGQN